MSLTQVVETLPIVQAAANIPNAMSEIAIASKMDIELLNNSKLLIPSVNRLETALNSIGFMLKG
jgi:hypothetical protein